MSNVRIGRVRFEACVRVCLDPTSPNDTLSNDMLVMAELENKRSLIQQIRQKVPSCEGCCNLIIDTSRTNNYEADVMTVRSFAHCRINKRARVGQERICPDGIAGMIDESMMLRIGTSAQRASANDSWNFPQDPYKLKINGPWFDEAQKLAEDIVEFKVPPSSFMTGVGTWLAKELEASGNTVSGDTPKTDADHW